MPLVDRLKIYRSVAESAAGPVLFLRSTKKDKAGYTLFQGIIGRAQQKDLFHYQSQRISVMQIATNAGKAGAIRVENLDATDLANAERHGKREDASGARRSIKEADPLVFRGLDIVERCEAHRKGRKQQGKTKAMHALIQFPADLIPDSIEEQKRMTIRAVDFVNQFYGGDAVFAARYDRDEKGSHKVDVFFLPRWQFKYKDGRTQDRCGIGQYAKKEAKARFGKVDRRACGSALQDALFEYLRDDMKVQGVMPPVKKKTTEADRLEPEAYALKKEKETLARAKREFQMEKEKAINALALKKKELDREMAIVVSVKRSQGEPIDPELAELNRKREAERKARRGRGLER